MNNQIEWKSNINIRDGFDIVIANPPYVDIKSLQTSLVKYFFANYKFTSNRINLYSIFIEKGFSLLNKEGFLTFIIPNSILTQSSYLKLRKYILDELNIFEIIRVSETVFFDIKVEPIIFSVSKLKKIDNKVKIRTFNRSEQINNGDILQKDIIIKSQSEWEKRNEYVYDLYVTNNESSVIEKFNEKNNYTFDQVLDISLGITPYDKYRGHSEEIINTKAFHKNLRVDNNSKILISGDNIARYSFFSSDNYYIQYGDWLGASREKKFFDEKHLIVKQIIDWTSKRIHASFIPGGYYNTQIGFNILIKNNFTDKINLYYILALLNSKLFSFIHRYCFLDKEKTRFQKILIKDVRKFGLILNDDKNFLLMYNKIINYSKDLQDKSNVKVSLINSFLDLLGNNSDKDLKNKHSIIYKFYNLTLETFLDNVKKIKVKHLNEQNIEKEFLDYKKNISNLTKEIEIINYDLDQIIYNLYDLSIENISIIEAEIL